MLYQRKSYLLKRFISKRIYNIKLLFILTFVSVIGATLRLPLMYSLRNLTSRVKSADQRNMRIFLEYSLLVIQHSEPSKAAGRINVWSRKMIYLN